MAQSTTRNKKNSVQSRKSKTEATKASKPTTWQAFTIPHNWTVMQIAIGISVLIHLILLSIHFEPELSRFKDSIPVLEVMLVNTKTEAKPKEADTFAQANLNRGGNTDLDKRMQSPLPATQRNQTNTVISSQLLKKSTSDTDTTDEADDSEENEIQRLKKLEQQAQSLMIQLKSTAKVKTAQTEATSLAKDMPKQTQNKQEKAINTINQTMLEMTRLEALIAKQYEEYQKRPKRKFIGAKATEYRYALYVDKWRQRVEEIGNNNYPTAAKKLGIYGKLQLTVSIKKDGTIEKIELDRSSGHKVLDAAAQYIVEMGAPYEKFPDNISKDTDILSITRTWTFTKESTVQTQE